MKFKSFTLIFAFVLSAAMLKAQDPKEYKTWNLGLDLGIAKSYTDIRQYSFNPSFQDKGDLNYNFGLHLTKSLTPVFGIKGRFTYAKVTGSLLNRGPEAIDRINEANGGWTSATANPYFGGYYSESDLYGGSLNLVIHFSNLGFFKRNTEKPRKWLFYGTAGFGVMGYDAEVRYFDGSNTEYPKDELVTGNRLVSNDNEDPEFYFPAGLGIKYNLGNKFDIGLEALYNLTTTDVLDGFALGTEADKFGSVALTLNYKLNSKTAGADADLLEWSTPGETVFTRLDELEKKIAEVDSTLTNHINTTDTDGDGIPDVEDKEPYSLFGAEVDGSGMAKDSDGDGVPDGLDKEPDTPKGELVNYQGVTIKQSTDETSGIKPEDIRREIITDAAYFPSVFFTTNSSQVKSGAMDKLVRVAIAMQKNPDLKVTVTGHADSRGSEAYNTKLAQRRADAVKNYLVRNLGVSADRISTEAKGENSPLSSTMYSVNRRVDIQGVK